jgi:hypothetical protein
MRTTIVMAAVMAAWPVAAQTPAKAKEPTAEQVLDAFLEATGGPAAYAKVKSMALTGAMEIAGRGVKGTLSIYHEAPNKSYMAMELEGVGKIEQGTSGEVAWERNPIQGPRVKNGEERALALRNADIGGQADWRRHYKGAKLEGSETVDGKECWKLVMEPAEGKPETRFYDKNSKLLLKTVLTVKTPMGEVAAEAYTDDYQESGGLVTPRKRRERVLGQELTTTIESVNYNVEIPRRYFEFPADVKALLEKAAAPAAK